MNQISVKDVNSNESFSTSTARSCPLARYGCEKNLQPMSIREHYVTEQHQKRLVKLTQGITQQKNSNSLFDASVEQVTVRLHDYYENSNVEQLKPKYSSFVEEIDEAKALSASQKAHVNGISINQNVLTQDVSDMKQQMTGSTHRTFNGAMVWKISHVREKMYDAQSERHTNIYSPAFYTSTTGYKLCVRLYLNGDGTARGTHLSLFLVMLRGRYDALLQWPFTYRVSFCLFDQRTMLETGDATNAKHIIDSFRPDPKSISFGRPQSAINIASGIPKFFPLIDFDQPKEINRYIIDDTVFIKVLIDFIGVPKAVLPFIFSINIALPIEIQQKLIDDEIKRREEQNIQ